MGFGPRQSLFLRALASKRYQQIHGIMFNGTGYCPLGIAAVLAGHKFTQVGKSLWYRCGEHHDVGYPPRPVWWTYYRFTKAGMNRLVAMNDNKRITFRTMYEQIRDHPWMFFQAPA